MHYSTVHRHVCSECRRHFPSGHLLDVHLLEWHDAMFELMAAKQKMVHEVLNISRIIFRYFLP